MSGVWGEEALLRLVGEMATMLDKMDTNGQVRFEDVDAIIELARHTQAKNGVSKLAAHYHHKDKANDSQRIP